MNIKILHGNKYICIGDLYVSIPSTLYQVHCTKSNIVVVVLYVRVECTSPIIIN